MEKTEFFYEITAHGFLTGIRLATAVFFYILLKHFVGKKRAAFAGISYFIMMTVLYYIPPVIPNLLAYGTGMLTVFVVLVAGETTGIRRKAFLSITFFVFRWLSQEIAGQLMTPVTNWADGLFTQADTGAMKAEFLVMEVVQLLLTVLILGITARLFLRVYQNGLEEFTNKEFVMLLMPVLAQVIAYQIVADYYDLYDEAMRAGIVGPAYRFNHTLLFFCLFSYIALFVFFMFYQELKESREKHREQEMLAARMENLREHIDMAEHAYEEIRGVRHDMGNHLMILKGLIGSGEHTAAEEYAKKMERAVDPEESGIRSGSPVTDVILREYVDKFSEKGIAFTCNFHYPVSDRLDSFDMSIVLANALQNAYEALEKESDPAVTVNSYRKKNAFIVEVSNTCSRKLQISDRTGLPLSEKKNVQAHGYGLKNIRRVAQKYYGDIGISTENGKFTLTVMLMLQ